jgi:FkbM family methyltransferase
MDGYHLNQNAKTRFLNYFRSVFTLPLFENVLLMLLFKSKFKIFQKLVPPDYLYKSGSFRFVERDGIKYKLDISNVVDHYLYYGIKDATYDSILETLKNAKVIIDIGANIGTTSLFYASINPGARILGFEPHFKTFNRAKENIALNYFENIELINMGLGEKAETLKLYEVNSNNPGMNRILTEAKDLPFSKINIDKLDSVLNDKQIPKADFIKIDVEGFEYSVLLGSQETLKLKPVLLIELDDDNLKENNKSAKMLIEFLITCGYTNIYRADNLELITLNSNFDNCHYDIIVK